MTKHAILILLLTCHSLLFAQNLVKERLAILDFKVIGNNEEIKNFEWLELGFAESLSDAFSRIPEFSIIERSQITRIFNEQKFQKENFIDSISAVKMGKLLGVKSVLIGSCQIYTGHMMINMRIVNVETGEIQAVSSPLIGPIQNVLNLQKQMCIAVMEKYGIINTPKKNDEVSIVTSSSTKNFLAYEYLNKGIDFFTNRQFSEALILFDKALKEDKKYGKAYYRKGITNIKLNNFAEAAENFEKSDKYLKKDSIYVLMSHAFSLNGDDDKARNYLEKAKKVNPNNRTVNSKLSQIQNRKTNISNKIETIETIYEYTNGIAKVRTSNNKYGYIDLENKVIIPTVYDDLGSFKNGLARVKIDSKWGFINAKGEIVISPAYTDATPFDEFGLSRVEIKDKWGIINTSGKVIIPIEFIVNTYYSGWKSEKMMTVGKFKNLLALDVIYGVYDRNGTEILPIVYDGIEIPQIYDENYTEIEYPYIHVSLNGKWGIVNLKNEIVAPFVYQDRKNIRPFKNGYSAIMINQKWGFINNKGIQIVAPTYERVEDFKMHFALVKSKEKWGVINEDGKEIIACIYSKVEYLKNNFWAVKKENLWGIINSSNAQICDFEYEKMASEVGSWTLYPDPKFEKNLLKVPVIKNKKKYWINEKCECISGCK